MGLFDSISRFLDSRQGDFVKLDKNQEVFGPGPLIILYNVPDGIENDEILDIVYDWAPHAHSQGCILHRIYNDKASSEASKNELNQSMEEVLHQIASGRAISAKSPLTARSGDFTSSFSPLPPVLIFFSGFQNEEMMNVYNILGKEIYDETEGRISPGCAKAVPNAMKKPLGQVLDEIASDHADAMKMDQE